MSEEFMFRRSRLRGPLGAWCVKAHRISGEKHAMAMLIIFERKTPWGSLLFKSAPGWIRINGGNKP